MRQLWIIFRYGLMMRLMSQDIEKYGLEKARNGEPESQKCRVDDLKDQEIYKDSTK